MKNQIAALLLVAATITIAGCDSSLESRNAAAYQNASQTSHNYDALQTTLQGAIERLDAIRKTPGTPENFTLVINAVDKQVAEANDALRASRTALINNSNKQIEAMNAQAAKFSDPSMARTLRSEAEALRDAYLKYENESQEINADIDTARKHLNDVRLMMNANASAGGVDNSIDSVKKAVSSLKDAKSDIADARSALEKLEKALPRAPLNS